MSSVRAGMCTENQVTHTLDKLYLFQRKETEEDCMGEVGLLRQMILCHRTWNKGFGQKWPREWWVFSVLPSALVAYACDFIGLTICLVPTLGTIGLLILAHVGSKLTHKT